MQRGPTRPVQTKSESSTDLCLASPRIPFVWRRSVSWLKETASAILERRHSSSGPSSSSISLLPILCHFHPLFLDRRSGSRSISCDGSPPPVTHISNETDLRRLYLSWIRNSASAVEQRTWLYLHRKQQYLKELNLISIESREDQCSMLVVPGTISNSCHLSQTKNDQLTVVYSSFNPFTIVSSRN